MELYITHQSPVIYPILEKYGCDLIKGLHRDGRIIFGKYLEGEKLIDIANELSCSKYWVERRLSDAINDLYRYCTENKIIDFDIIYVRRSKENEIKFIKNLLPIIENHLKDKVAEKLEDKYNEHLQYAHEIKIEYSILIGKEIPEKLF